MHLCLSSHQTNVLQESSTHESSRLANKRLTILANKRLTVRLDHHIVSPLAPPLSLSILITASPADTFICCTRLIGWELSISAESPQWNILKSLLFVEFFKWKQQFSSIKKCSLQCIGCWWLLFIGPHLRVSLSPSMAEWRPRMALKKPQNDGSTQTLRSLLRSLLAFYGCSVHRFWPGGAPLGFVFFCWGLF